jgi:hypothetical protein
MTASKTAIIDRLQKGVSCGSLTIAECAIVENVKFTSRSGIERKCIRTREIITGTPWICRDALFVEQKSARRS